MAKAMKGLQLPPYMASTGLMEVDGLDVETTDSVLAMNDTDDVLGENNLVPAAPYGAGSVVGGPNSGMK